MRFVGALAVLATIAAACQREAPHRTGFCETVPEDASCGSNNLPPVNGTPRSDAAGTSSGDAAVADADASAVNLVGEVVVSSALPIATGPDASRAGAGWRVTSVPSPSSSADEFATADSTGSFALAAVPVSAGSVVLRATPPDGTRALGALTTTAAGSGSVTIVAVESAALEQAAASAGFVVAPGRAHLVIQLVDTPTTAAGVTLDFVDATAANVAYDDARGALSAVAPTGALGTIAAFNIAASTRGDAVVGVRLQRGGRVATYRLPVASDHVTWIRALPP